MRDIIIAFPVRDAAIRLKHFLEQEGLYVSHICALGSSALSICQDSRDGIIICAERLSDMSAINMANLLPPDFDVVALTNGSTDSIMSNLVYLSLPVDRNELIQTVLMLSGTASSYSKRAGSDYEIISQAKRIIMKRYGIPETQAHKKLQQMSMKTGRNLVTLSKEIISNAQ